MWNIPIYDVYSSLNYTICKSFSRDMLLHIQRLPFKRLGFSNATLVLCGNDRDDGRLVYRFTDVPQVIFRGHPSRTISSHVDGSRVADKRLCSVRIKKILVKVGHHEFPDRAVYWVAVPQDRMVRLADGTIVPILLEEGDDVVVVGSPHLQTHDERFPTHLHEANARKESTFNAVRRTSTEYANG